MICFLIILQISELFGLTEIEKVLTKDITDRFRIKHCILISTSENKISLFDDHKLMSKWNILANVKSLKEIDYYINDYLYPWVHPGSQGTDLNIWKKSEKLLMPKTLVIFQKTNLEILSRIFYPYYNGQTTGYFTWIAFLEESEHPTASHDIKVAYNTEFIVITRMNKTSYKLVETYKVQKAQFVLDYGIWDLQNGLKTNDLSLIQRRANINKTLLYVNGISWSYDQTLHSYHERILIDFTEMINARIEIVTGRSGEELTILDHLHSISDVTYVKEAVGPILNLKSYLYIKEPKMTGSSTYFLSSFSRNLWLSLLCTLVLASFFFILLHIQLEDELRKEKIELIDFCFKVLEIYCNQTGSINPKRISINMATYIMRLLIVIMFSAYSAVLLSQLLVRIPHSPFKSLEELNQTSFSVGCTSKGFEYFYFLVSRKPFYRHIYKNMIENKVSENDTIELTRACKENHAHITYPHVVRMNKHNCRLFQIKEPVITRLSSIRFHPHTGGISILFSYKLLWLFSSGIIQKMQQELKGLQMMESSQNYLPVEIEHSFYVLATFATAIFVSFAIFVGEQLFHKTERVDLFQCLSKTQKFQLLNRKTNTFR